MKTFRRITALLIAMLAISLFAFAFAACKNTPDDSAEHTCEYETAWTSDESYHWHKCKDADCTKTSEKTAHVWDDGVETTAATVYAKGVKTYTCKDCGKTKTEDISVTDKDAFFAALKASALKMQQSGSMYIIDTSTSISTSGSSTGSDYITWDSNGKGAEKVVDQSTSSDGKTTTSTYYALANVVGDKYHLTNIGSQDDGPFAISNKEYVSNDYYTKNNYNSLDELMEQMTLSESDLKTMLIDSLKSMAGSLDLIDSTTKEEIDMNDVAEENIVYACTVSLENGVAKIEATVSFKAEWLNSVSAGEDVSVKNFDMKMIYAFTADKITKAESQYGFTMVMAGKEMASSMYTAYEFDTNFNQTLFDEAVAVEAACPAYEGTVKAHSARIKIYANGEEYDNYYVSVPYDDKAAAKENIDNDLIPFIKNNLKESYDGEDTVVVKAYLDEACTKEYTEDNKNDLAIDCVDGAKIYLKVTPIDNTKTVVYYAYKVSNVGYSYSRGTYLVLADRTSGYKIITAPYSPDEKYEDEIKVDGTVLADGVTTIDLTEKSTVTIICTRNGMD